MHFQTFLLVNTCQSGGHYLVNLAFTFRYKFALKEHLLFVDHFNKKIKYFIFPLMYSLEMSFMHSLVLRSCQPCRDMCHRKICVTGEFRSVINVWTDDYGHS